MSRKGPAQVGTEEVEQRATMLLALLAQNNVNRPKIIFHGGFKPLMYNAQYGRTAELRQVRAAPRAGAAAPPPSCVSART